MAVVIAMGLWKYQKHLWKSASTFYVIFNVVKHCTHFTLYTLRSLDVSLFHPICFSIFYSVLLYFLCVFFSIYFISLFFFWENLLEWMELHLSLSLLPLSFSPPLSLSLSLPLFINVHVLCLEKAQYLSVWYNLHLEFFISISTFRPWSQALPPNRVKWPSTKHEARNSVITRMYVLS
jgi:hypothetical protein